MSNFSIQTFDYHAAFTKIVNAMPYPLETVTINAQDGPDDYRYMTWRTVQAKGNAWTLKMTQTSFSLSFVGANWFGMLSDFEQEYKKLRMLIRVVQSDGTPEWVTRQIWGDYGEDLARK